MLAPKQSVMDRIQLYPQSSFNGPMKSTAIDYWELVMGARVQASWWYSTCSTDIVRMKEYMISLDHISCLASNMSPANGIGFISPKVSESVMCWTEQIFSDLPYPRN